MKKTTFVALTASSLVLLCASAALAQAPEIRVGIIGTDTSHVTAFTRLLNDRSDPKVMAFMEAAELSKTRGGAPVALAEVTRAK